MYSKIVSIRLDVYDESGQSQPGDHVRVDVPVKSLQEMAHVVDSLVMVGLNLKGEIKR